MFGKPHSIAERIRDAATQGEVIGLLREYTDLTRNSARLPAEVRTPPGSFADLANKCTVLLRQVDAASRQLDDSAVAATKDALYVFSAGLGRLQVLQRQEAACRHLVWQSATSARPSAPPGPEVRSPL